MRDKLIIFLLLLLYISTTSSVAPKKCSGDEEYDKGVTMLKDYTLVKDYRVSLGSGKKGEASPSINYPISLTKGMKYKLFAVNHPDNTNKMIVSIFANEKGEVLLASTYSTSVKKHYDYVEFDCKTTGTFYITFQFEGGASGCGVGFFCIHK